MADVSSRLSGLSAKQLMVLAERLKKAQGLKSNRIERIGGDRAPLSFGQERLWFINQLEPGNPVYNNSLALRVKDGLGELEEGVNELVRRHEVLRSSFPVVDGKPIQMIAPALRLRSSYVDLSMLPAAEREPKAMQLAESEAQRPFDLENGPLVRSRTVILGEEDFLLLSTQHHVITDGYSDGIMQKEVAYFRSFYHRLRTSNPPEQISLLEVFASDKHTYLPELPIQYGDYAAWERGRLQGEVLDRLMAYWKKQLSSLPVSNLPTDRPRSDGGNHPGARQAVTLSGELTDALNELSQQEGVTLFMTLLAAFKVLLYRHSGQDDIVVGSPIAGRNRKEAENLVGFFVNMLVLRTGIDGSQSFKEILRSVKETCLGAYAHQEMPFARLVKELNPERALDRHPLFQIGFQLNNTSVSFEMQTGDDAVSNRLMWLDTRRAMFDLQLTVDRIQSRGRLGEGGFKCVLEYDADLFEAQTARSLVNHFHTLLEKVTDDADRRIDDIELLSEEEGRLLLVDWNQTPTESSPGKCIQESFEEQAEMAADRIAVACEEECLTYGELNKRANQLAHYLRKRGVGPDVVVGICIERSVEMLVGLLGILKAGGAYLPIEPEYPAERIAYLLEDSRVSVLLTKESSAKSLPYQSPTIICVDREKQEIERGPLENLPIETNAQNLAYVIYTSGSTGKPKGVLIEHNQVARLFSATRQWYAFGRDDVWTMLHSYAFDFSVWEIWGALLHGGEVIVVPNEVRKNPEAVYELLQEKAVTILNQTPSAFRQLGAVDERMGGSDRLNLRAVIFGGEALELCSLKGWFERHGDKRPALINMYGITETTVHVTYRPIQAEEASTETRSVIGQRIPDLKMYLLDKRMRPAPVGVIGEIFVGGEGQARGYLGKPDLTAERFLPNEYAGRGGERVYRTGDQARYRPDGEIEYIGRADNQVKIRGYRIELGEIEAALGSHPAVREAVVMPTEDSSGGKRLVAYVVCDRNIRASEAPTDKSVDEDPSSGIVTQLRRYLRAKLPEYMVPSTFVVMDAMPLNHNGKIDRRALPEAESSRPQLEEAFKEPCNEIERMLAQIWAEALRLDRVGVHDNFFELGGDSILAIQIISRANQAGLQLSAKQIFQNQTIAELAAVTGSAGKIEEEQSLVTGPAPLTPIQLWFFEQELADAYHYNRARILELRSDVEPGLLKKAVEEIVNHHDALRLRFDKQDAEWKQNDRTREEGEIFIELDLSGVDKDERPRALNETATRIQAGLNLSDGPLVKVALINLGEEAGKRLLIVIHHLVVDGVSWRILLEDLQRAYEQAKRGEISPARKTTSFKRWAEKLNEYAQSDDLKKEAGYWIELKRTLVLGVPLDNGSGENTVESARTVAMWLSEEETSALLQDVPAAYRTQINDVLLAALALAYREWTGSERLLIDLEGHGREEIIDGADITRTVGWFTTIYPVVLELGEEGRPGEIIKAVKEQLRAIPNKGIGYGLLRYLSEDDEVRRTLKEGSEPEVVFNYLGQMGRSTSDPGMFGMARESAGPVRSSRQKRRHVLEVNGGVFGGRLKLIWTYSENLHRRETIEMLAESYKNRLKAIVEHCTSIEAGGYTPSDFPLAGLNQKQLDELVGADPNIEDVYRLSPMQEGLLFHSLYQPEEGAYVVQMSVVTAANVNREDLENKWQRVAEKNDLMRASFIWEGVDHPVQVVRKKVIVPFEYRDWRGLNSQEQQDELERYLREDRKRGFNLREAPLMRVCLIRRGENLHQWIWSHHHLLMDGWSLPLVLGQVSGTAEQPGATRPYRDYIEWLQKQDLGNAESYWRETLKGFAEPTRIGIEKSSQSAPAPREKYQEVSVKLSKNATERLERVAREQRLTLNTLVQGGWGLLLSRYSGEKDVVYGATVSGRPADLPGIDKVVGVFINTLPVRLKVGSEETAADCLKRLQEQQAEMRQYEYSPLLQVQAWSDVPRGEALFESIFAYENYPLLRPLQDKAKSSKLREMRLIERTNYPLSIVAVPGEQLLIKIIYDQSRYEENTVTRLLEHYERLLESLTNHIGQRVAEIEILTSEEKQLLTTWNDTAASYPHDKCIHELLEDKAASAADRVALVYEDRHITYADLNRRANKLGHYLRGIGVGPEVVTGICVDRSPEMVIGLLGILKAGGAYLPLDPQYPKQRLEFMLDDARVKFLVTTEALLEELGGFERRVVMLDSDWEQIARQSEQNPVRVVDSRDTAYVIYTSGSTGNPKGVMVEHRGARNMAEAQIQSFGVSSESCVLQFASLSFDASIFEIVMTLRTGARLCLAAKENLLPGPGLAELVESRCITNITIPPSALSLVPEDSMPGLRTIIVAGEACPETLAAQWTAVTRFFNAYGPTEATVWSTVQKCDGRETPTIGRPIANVQIYILDSEHNPVPVGARGEIYIAGDGLARGYLGRPELTAERFIANTYSGQPGSRLYRTGDLGRYRADGQIEYVGRADHQVKIRGYRIEIGEIEAALRENEAVEECVVVVRELEGEKRLVGYFVNERGDEPNVTELRDFLKNRLPEYMIPGAFVMLDALPLTQNGKIDRGRLPEPKANRLSLREPYAPPRNEAEGIITTIWQEILKVDRVGLNDNFFDLGGHSLLMIKIHNKLQDVFNRKVPMVEMFRHPTVRGMAAHLTDSRSRDASSAKGRSRAMIRKKLTRRQDVSNQLALAE